MSKVTSVKIDVSKIDKSRLYKGKKGLYLDAIIVWGEDQYGNDGFMAESVSKEEREAGKKGTIIGNVKNLGGSNEQKPQNKPNDQIDDSFDDMDDDLPFMWLLIPFGYTLMSMLPF